MFRNLKSWVASKFWPFVLGGVATAILGFGWGGWHLESGARKLAEEEAKSAVTAALVPFCVAFAQREDQSASLAEFRVLTKDYDREKFVRENTSWAFVPGEKSSNRELAKACASALMAPQA